VGTLFVGAGKNYHMPAFEILPESAIPLAGAAGVAGGNNSTRH
jgi:hypothetical protein